MNREKLLRQLSIRLTHLVESSDQEINALLVKYRDAIKNDADEKSLIKISDQLTKQMMVQQSGEADTPASLNDIASEFSRTVKGLKLDGVSQNSLLPLTRELELSADTAEQLNLISQILQLVVQAVKDTPAQKQAGGKIKGWFDRKNKTDEDSGNLLELVDKSKQLMTQILSHIDVLKGNETETDWLKEEVEKSESIESIEPLLGEAISMLADMTSQVQEERATTENYLTDLRDKLQSTEELIFSVMTDGDDTLDRAESFEQQMNTDVQVLGKITEEDDLPLLKKKIDVGLSHLTAKVTDYLADEKQHLEKSKKKVRDLSRKVRKMENEAINLKGMLKTKQDLAVKDPLTGVYNRGGYEERVEEEFARLGRVETPLSLVFIDCNKFKQINDTFGHHAGDLVLVQVANTLQDRARASDIIARYGGDEFVVLLPDTDIAGAETFARAVYQKIIQAGFNNNGEPLDVSVSCGVTQLREEDTQETFLKRADDAMYKAKKVSGEKVFVMD